MTKEELKELNTTTCLNPSCGEPLGNVAVLCHTCFFKLPTMERVGLRRLFLKQQPTHHKLQRCLRILKDQETIKPASQ